MGHKILTCLYRAVAEPAAWEEGLRLFAEEIVADAVLLTIEDPSSGKARVLVQTHSAEKAAWHFEAGNGALHLMSRLQGNFPLGETVAVSHANPNGRCALGYCWCDVLPDGFAEGLLTPVVMRGALVIGLVCLREDGCKPFGETERDFVASLQPHLAEVFHLIERFDGLLLELRASRQLFGDLGFPLLFVTHEIRVTYMTEGAACEVERCPFLELSVDKLAARHPHDQELLMRLVRRCIESARSDTRRRVLRATLRGNGDVDSRTLLALPIGPYARREDTHRPAVALQLPSRGGRRAPSVPVAGHHLEQRYGLNDREARLVRHLLCGKNVRECAVEMGVAYDTARWYLKGVYNKIGVIRQTELVRVVLDDFIRHLDFEGD
ncbi:hypothetical protein H0Z60_17670 [Ectothiorhodospiraceae bacterium WFHF3C12]|nr:hypothetical protein [Ectothiorhodospiraceae bacterium WFHF3C12]